MPGDLVGKSGKKIMLGFIMRRCAMELGHIPTPDEFADWANSQEKNGKRYSLFGRPISPATAELMLRHPGRPVTVRLQSIVKESRG